MKLSAVIRYNSSVTKALVNYISCYTQCLFGNATS